MDDTSIPTGEIRGVRGAMDLRQARIGAAIAEADNGTLEVHRARYQPYMAYRSPLDAS